MRRILLLLLLAVACAVPAAAQTDTTAAVRPADLVRLVVWRMPEFSGEFAVGQDGTIQHPLLTEVRVVGRPRDEVRRQLREVLLRYENDPQFVFDYLYRVAVTGEVRLPNLYSLPPETSIPQAIAAAGGLAEFGRINDVRLIRNGQEMVLDLRDPTSQVMEMRIRSGDQIRVLRRGSSFRDYLGLTASLVAALGSVVAALTVLGSK